MSQSREIWAETDAERAIAFELRHRVFVREQGIPIALEDDGRDARSHHLLLSVDGAIVATGRLRIDAGVAELSRIAVDEGHRGQGLGQIVVAALEGRGVQFGCRRAVLRPHAYLERFYRRLGYQVVEGFEASAGDHPLIEMTKNLEPT